MDGRSDRLLRLPRKDYRRPDYGDRCITWLGGVAARVHAGLQPLPPGAQRGRRRSSTGSDHHGNSLYSPAAGAAEPRRQVPHPPRQPKTATCDDCHFSRWRCRGGNAGVGCHARAGRLAAAAQPPPLARQLVPVLSPGGDEAMRHSLAAALTTLLMAGSAMAAPPKSRSRA